LGRFFSKTKKRQTKFAKKWIKDLPELLAELDEDRRAARRLKVEQQLLKEELATAHVEQENNKDLDIDEEKLTTLVDVERLLLAEHAYSNEKSRLNEEEGNSTAERSKLEHDLDRENAVVKHDGELRRKYGLGPVGSEGNLVKLMSIDEILKKGSSTYLLAIPASVDDTGITEKQIAGKIIVSQVRPGSWADSSGIREGAVITSINRKDTKDMSLEEYNELMDARATSTQQFEIVLKEDTREADALLDGEEVKISVSDKVRKYGKETSEENTKWRETLGYLPPGATANVKKVLGDLVEASEGIELVDPKYVQPTDLTTTLQSNDATLRKMTILIEELQKAIGKAKKDASPKATKTLETISDKLLDIEKIIPQDVAVWAEMRAQEGTFDDESRMAEKAKKENFWLLKKQEANAQMQKDVRKLLAEEDAYFRKAETQEENGEEETKKDDENVSSDEEKAASDEKKAASDEEDVSNEEEDDSPDDYVAADALRSGPEGPLAPAHYNTSEVDVYPDNLAAANQPVSSHDPDVWMNSTEALPYNGTAGLRTNYSGLKECGDHLQKVVKEAKDSVAEATKAAIIAVDNTNQLAVHHKGLNDNLRDYRKAEEFFKENVKKKHTMKVKKVRRLLARDIPLGVVQEAHRRTDTLTRAHRASARAKREEKPRTLKVDGEALTPAAHNVWWAKLPEHVKLQWEALGWTQASWDRDLIVPASATQKWKKLSGEEKDSATRLGFNSKSWNASLVSAAPGAHFGLAKVKDQDLSAKNLDQDEDIVDESEMGVDSESAASPAPQSGARDQASTQAASDPDLENAGNIEQSDEAPTSRVNSVPRGKKEMSKRVIKLKPGAKIAFTLDHDAPQNTSGPTAQRLDEEDNNEDGVGNEDGSDEQASAGSHAGAAQQESEEDDVSDEFFKDKEATPRLKAKHLAPSVAEDGED